jgi:hypothetical protein
VAVLLEEQPLQGLRPCLAVGWPKIRVLGQIAEDGVGFGQVTAVLEPQGGNAAVGVQRQERGRPGLALEDVHLDPLEGQPELGQQ